MSENNKDHVGIINKSGEIDFDPVTGCFTAKFRTYKEAYAFIEGVAFVNDPALVVEEWIPEEPDEEGNYAVIIRDMDHIPDQG